MEPGGMYDSGFEAYRTVTPEEYRSVLRTGLVILDTNVLLHLYRYHSGTRKDLMDILTAIKDRLWVPYQVMDEFWKGRSGALDSKSKEIEETIGVLQENELRINEGIRHWANRIGLPRREKERILDRVKSTIDHTANRIRVLSDADAAETTSDTNQDPILATLEPILDASVGRPLTCPFTGLDATRRCAAVVELLAQVEHACGSCPMSPGLAASRVTWSRGCGL